MINTCEDVRTRADSYKLLSECYYLPDEALIQKIIDGSHQGLFSELADGVPPAVDLEALKIEFTRLFIGPFKLLAPPYGSVYLEDNRMMGESTVDARNRYEQEGLDITLSDAPDHIAMELEFMYYLVTQELKAMHQEDAEALQACQEKQRSFLQVHLAKWLPRFAEKVQENGQVDFYKTLAQVTDRFVQAHVSAF
jgi:TorA maturation chaperone TorD